MKGNEVQRAERICPKVNAFGQIFGQIFSSMFQLSVLELILLSSIQESRCLARGVCRLCDGEFLLGVSGRGALWLEKIPVVRG